MAKRVSKSTGSGNRGSSPSANDRAAIEGRAMATAGVTGPPSPDAESTGSGQPGFDSYGISGLTRFGVVSRVYEEFLRELQGPQGMKSLREMSDNCPITGAILFASNHLCRKVSFKFKPADDSQQARLIADKIGSMIFDDMESTWPDTLSEILTMLQFGWALMEYRFKRRLGMEDPDTQRVSFLSGINDADNAPQSGLAPPPPLGTAQIGGVGYPVADFATSRFKDGMIGFRSWQLRSQETLFMWEFDEDSNAIVMQQMAPPDYRIRRIPMSKCLQFRTQVAKNNPEGRSILRNAWTSYYFKKNLQVFEGIGIERDLAGYPVIQMVPPDHQKGQMPPDVWNSKDPSMVALLAALQKMVRSVRRDEQEGMVLPWWCEFKLLSTGSRRSFDTNAIIGRYDQRIAMSVMADFIMLGHEAVGSKALASTKISLFTSALSSFLDSACSVINRHAVTTLMRMNGWPQELSPILQHGDVESVNLQELGDFISKIAGTGFNVLASPDVQRAILETAKLPTSEINLMNSNTADDGTNTNDPNRGGIGDSKEGEGDASGGGGPVAANESPMGQMSSLQTS